MAMESQRFGGDVSAAICGLFPRGVSRRRSNIRTESLRAFSAADMTKIVDKMI
jgi:hypothetical protein